MLVALCAIVAGAFFVEALTGFGSTVLTVAFGAQLVPLDALLPAVVPVNLALSTYMVVRHGRHVDRRLLLREVLPLMGLGFPLGFFAFAHLTGGGDAALKVAFGGLVTALAATELLRARTTPRPLPRGLAPVLLILAGVVHGAYGSGGPLLVYVLSRRGLDKSVFRATLSTIWLVLGLALLTGYATQGLVTRDTLTTSAALVPSLALGLLLGERGHARVDASTFRLLTLVLLLAGGLLLVARNLS